MTRNTFQLERNHETTKRLGLALKNLPYKVKIVKEYDNSFLYEVVSVVDGGAVVTEDYNLILDRVLGNV